MAVACVREFDLGLEDERVSLLFLSLNRLWGSGGKIDGCEGEAGELEERYGKAELSI